MSGENMSKTNEVRPIDANALCAILEAKSDRIITFVFSAMCSSMAFFASYGLFSILGVF